MKCPLCILAAATAIFCDIQTSIAQPTDFEFTMSGMSGKKIAFPPAGLKETEGEEAVATKELVQKISECVSKKDYARLDGMADDLRKSKLQIAKGIWHLRIFYRILAFDECTIGNQAEPLWKTRLEFLESWTNAKPTSVTARVALGMFYTDYAWHARGADYVNTVSNEGWRLFEERLKQAKQVLMDARKLDSKCPVWWDIMQNVALGLSWNLESYNKLFDEAVAFEPTYISFYNNKALYLMPRWLGKEGDWQKFANQAADKLGGESGDILYARMGWRVNEHDYYDVFLRDSGYSWPRMKKGLEAIIKQHTNSLTATSELAFLAYQAQDRTCAKTQFEKIGKRVDYEVWQHDVFKFSNAKTWAFSE